MFVENSLATLGFLNISRTVLAGYTGSGKYPTSNNITWLFFHLILPLCTGHWTFQATHHNIVTDGASKLLSNFFSYRRCSSQPQNPERNVLQFKVVKYYILCQCTVIAGLLLVHGIKIRRCWCQSILGILRAHC